MLSYILQRLWYKIAISCIPSNSNYRIQIHVFIKFNFYQFLYVSPTFDFYRTSQVHPLTQPSHSTQSLPANIRPFTLIPRVVLERLLPEQFERPTTNPSPPRAQTSRYPSRRRQPPKRYSN